MKKLMKSVLVALCAGLRLLLTQAVSGAGAAQAAELPASVKVTSAEQVPVAKQTVAGNAPGRAVINSVTMRLPWTGEIDIDYEGVGIPENNACVSHINLQYRLSLGKWINVPPEDYRQSSDWAEIVDGKLVHRIFNGVDRLTWNVRKTLGALHEYLEVRIVVLDLGVLWEWKLGEWKLDVDISEKLWPAKLLDLDLATGVVTMVPDSDSPADLDSLKTRALNEYVYFYRGQHMLFREVPAGVFKRGNRYWHFGGTAYVGVFRMTGDQYTMMASSTKVGDLKIKQVALEVLRGTGASARGEPQPTSLLGKLNGKIDLHGWRIDVLPDYAYGQRLLWAGNETCPVTDVTTANEYGDFSASPTAGSKRPSDWGFYDLVSGQEWTLSSKGGNYGPFGATSASDAKNQLNGDVNCNTPETRGIAVRLVMWRKGTSLDVKEVPADSFSCGEPASVYVDTYSEWTNAGPAAVAISYSGDDWGAGGSGVTVGCSWEGGAMQTLKEATDSGTFLWTPTLNGRYEFRHAVVGGATNTGVIVVTGLLGSKYNPWIIGDDVIAYVDDRVLHLDGEGEVTEFGGDGAPWAGYDEVLTGIGPLSHAIKIPASVAVTLPISVRGGGGKQSGAIGGAEFEAVPVVGGKAHLGISVCTNGEVAVTAEGWQKAKVEKAEVGNGAVVLTVPATGKQGFMILRTKAENGGK